MIKLDFDFFETIDRKLYSYLKSVQTSILECNYNFMSDIIVCIEYIITDICERENIYYSVSRDRYEDIYKNIYLLREKNILEEKVYVACHLIISYFMDNSNKINFNLEWSKLCMHNIYILVKWYVKKYYSINISREVSTKSIGNTIKEEPVTHLQGEKAYKNMNIKIKNSYDALLFFASANVLNAYVKQEDANLLITPKYEFKKKITEKLEEIIRNNIKDVDIYYSREITYVKIEHLQFSYKYLPTSKFMDKYEISEMNIPQAWEGVRLQPCAGSLFESIELLSN